MKIERIDPKTVKCFITTDEMRAYEITYKDFIMRSDKSKEILEQIIIQAHETVGFLPGEATMDIQIMMLPDKGMILTFSEKDSFEQQIDDMLGNCLKEILKLFESKLGGQGQVQAFAQEQNMVSPENPIVPANPMSPANPAVEPVQVHPMAPVRAGYIFQSIRTICDFANALPQGVQLISSLYRYRDHLYLWMECAGDEVGAFRETCFHAVEYGILYSTEESHQRFLKEHGEKILMNTALESLRRKTK
jgi:negative regulator of genetic competence, sporulation and motility